MSQWLFPNSLDDPTVYAKAQQHWETLWYSLASRVGSALQWRTPWAENPLLDGNPIFTAVSESRGLRIIQEDPRDPDDIDLDWWLDSAEGPTPADGIAELVIACCPSVENTPQVESLLRDWLTTGRVIASTRAEEGVDGRSESAIPNGHPLDPTNSELRSL